MCQIPIQALKIKNTTRNYIVVIIWSLFDRFVTSILFIRVCYTSQQVESYRYYKYRCYYFHYGSS